MLETIKRFLKNDNKKTNSKNNRLISINNSIIDTLFSVDASRFIKHLSDEEIEVILKDLTLSQVIESRKAATEKKELQVITKKEELKEIFENIFNTDVISQILDTHIFGFNVFELNYKKERDLLIPSLVQRDYRYFKLKNGELYFSKGYDVKIEKYKALYALYRPRFNKIYGDALLNKIYFPLKIKNASMEFWVRFLEKFGSPWAIGKTDQDPDLLADEIHAMLSGDTAVIDAEDDINLIQPASNSKDSFEAVINYCDKQIRNVVLGANLTSEVQGGSFAATKTHNEVREDIALVDAKILLSVANQVVEIFKDINNIKDELWIKLYSEDAPKIELSARDLNIYNMGYKPTKEYIEETYNIKVEENLIYQNKKLLKNDSTPLKRFLNDDIDNGVEEILKDENIENEILQTASIIFENSSSYEEAQLALLDHYKDIEFKNLEDTLKKALAYSWLYGNYNANKN